MSTLSRTIQGGIGRAVCTGVLAAALLASLVGCETNIRLREKGQLAAGRGDYEQARAYFEKAAQRKPTDALAHYELGKTWLELDAPLKAQASLERALVLEPANPDLTPHLLDLIAESIYRQGDYDALHNFFERTSGAYHTARDYLRQARYMVKVGDLDAAAQAYRKAAYYAPPGDASPYLAVADFYESVNDTPNAVAALRYAYYVDPQSQEIADRLRRHGVVPGPTVGEAPPKPQMLR